jgi:hypothetical protein
MLKRTSTCSSQWSGAGTPRSALRNGCPHDAAILRGHLIEVRIYAIFQNSPPGTVFMHRNRAESSVRRREHGKRLTWVIPDPLPLAVLDIA